MPVAHPTNINGHESRMTCVSAALAAAPRAAELVGLAPIAFRTYAPPQLQSEAPALGSTHRQAPQIKLLFRSDERGKSPASRARSSRRGEADCVRVLIVCQSPFFHQRESSQPLASTLRLIAPREPKRRSTAKDLSSRANDWLAHARRRVGAVERKYAHR